MTDIDWSQFHDGDEVEVTLKPTEIIRVINEPVKLGPAVELVVGGFSRLFRGDVIASIRKVQPTPRCGDTWRQPDGKIIQISSDGWRYADQRVFTSTLGADMGIPTDAVLVYRPEAGQ